MTRFLICIIVLISGFLAQAENVFYEKYMEEISERNIAYNALVLKKMPFIKILKKAQENGQVPESNPEIKAAADEVDRLEKEFDKVYMDSLVKQYAWAIPNDAAIEAIKNYVTSLGRGVIEVGAGKGYWAKLLHDQGVPMVAYDKYLKKESWFPVQRGTEKSVIFYSDHVLFLCWPPQMEKDGVAFKALKLYKGNYLIYVGERPRTPREMVATGDPEFFKLLEEQFDLQKAISIPKWPGFFDSLYFFERKADLPQLQAPLEAPRDLIYVPFKGLKNTRPMSDVPLRRYHSLETIPFSEFESEL